MRMILSIGHSRNSVVREFAQDNPDYKEKRTAYMREYRKRKKAEGGGRIAVGSWEVRKGSWRSRQNRDL